MAKAKNPAAVELGKLRVKKIGRTKWLDIARRAAALGGEARAKLPPERLKAIAKKAANTRWANAKKKKNTKL